MWGLVMAMAVSCSGPNGCLADTPQKQIQPAVSPESCSLRMPSKEGWCYHVSKAEMPWQAARLACQALGGQLSSITSSDEDRLIHQLAMEEAKGALWTGGCQQSPRSGWRWEEGRTWRFTRWPSCEVHTRCTWGEPQERGCLVVSQLGWQVEDPAESRKFICRIKERMEERALFYLLGLASGVLLFAIFCLDIICCCCCWRRRRRREVKAQEMEKDEKMAENLNSCQESDV